MDTTLKTEETEAGITKTPFVLSTPIATAASAISEMLGSIIWVSVVARAVFSGEDASEIRSVNWRVKRIPILQITLSTAAEAFITGLAKCHASFSVLLIS